MIKTAMGRLAAFLILAGLAAGLCGPGRALAAPDEPVDGYGYTYSNEDGLWIEANSGSLLSFPSQDDAYVGPLNIGFDFRFYDQTYSTLYVSTNGLVTFASGSSGLHPNPIPWPPTPNNLIAPLWSDLDLHNGRAYLLTQNGSTTIEWEIYDRNPADPGALLTLNFEVILDDATDNIRFQYNVLDSMPIDHVVGIEDDEGLFGLQYQPALLEGVDILFIRPAPMYRVKATPRFQGSFVHHLEAQYRLEVENNGENGADVYKLAVASASPGWQATFYNRTGDTLLGDTNGDLYADTGLMSQGSELGLTLKVAAPPTALPGDYTTLVFTATSTLDPTRWMTGTVQSSVPVQFTQIYVDGGLGIRMGQYWKENDFERSILNNYTGTTLSMESVSADNYLVAWESLGNNLMAVTDFYTDIHYKIASRFGWTSAELLLTNGAQLVGEPDIIQADSLSPTIAQAPDGRAGVAWSLFRRRSDNQKNSNIFFAILDAAGNRLSDRYNVTQDGGWFSGGHTYEYPNIAVTNDNRYLVCWIDQFSLGRGVRCATHTYGQQISQTAVVPVATAAQTSLSLKYLSLAALGDNRVLVAYAEDTGAASKVFYAVVSSAGALVYGPSEIPGVNGVQPRGTQFNNGDILLAWIERDGRVAYSYLDPSYGASPPQYLSHLSGRGADSLSVTLVPDGQAVLTWVDRDDQDYMYYAVLDQNQGLVTPPLIFLSNLFGDPLYQTSAFGFGNAGYLGIYSRYIPFVRR